MLKKENTALIDKRLQDKIISKNRDFMKGYRDDDPYMERFESDQDLKRPQPPLVKPAMAGEHAKIVLPKDFSRLSMKNQLVDLIRDRHSARVYTQESLSLEQLSFLLLATQGVKALRGTAYATLRTVPSGGARHEFETYLLISKVDGLAAGAYHYLPMEHALELLHPVENMEAVISDALCGQSWAAKANVVFFWAMVAYRAEWRYGIYAHRPALIDAGHVGQNLYLGCTGLGLGTCSIAAFSHELCNQVFGLDGEEEFVVYTAPVGTIRESDKAREQAFYQFVTDEGL